MSSPTFNEGDAHPLGLTKDTISRYSLERNQTHHVPPLCSFALSTRCSYFARARFRLRTQADCPLTVASTVPRCGTPPVARSPSHSHDILPCYGGQGFLSRKCRRTSVRTWRCNAAEFHTISCNTVGSTCGDDGGHSFFFMPDSAHHFHANVKLISPSSN